MISSSNFSGFSAEYYHEIAGFAGCIKNVMHELIGLTGDSYEAWYYDRCTFKYSLPISLFYKDCINIYRFSKVRQYGTAVNPPLYNRSNIKFMSDFFLHILTEEKIKLNTKKIMKVINENKHFWPLLYPRPRFVPARLHLARKMKVTKKNVIFFKGYEASVLETQLDTGYQRASDKRLYLAQQLRVIGERLIPSIPRFRDVRTNSTLLTPEALSNPNRRFDPRRNPQDKAPQVGITIATMQHLPILLARFEQEMLPVVPDAEDPVNYPWPEIDKVAEAIELWSNGEILVSKKFRAAAGAGFIDALLEDGLLSKQGTLPVLYRAFSDHYKCSIKADRMTDTRQEWCDKARRALRI